MNDRGDEQDVKTTTAAEENAVPGKRTAPKPFDRPLTVQEHQFCAFYVRQGEGTKVAPSAYRQAFGPACDGMSAIKVSMRAYALLQQPAVQQEIQHQRELMLEERSLFDQKMREASFDKVEALKNVERESFVTLWRALKFHGSWIAKNKPPLATGMKAVELGLKVNNYLKGESPVVAVNVEVDKTALDREIEDAKRQVAQEAEKVGNATARMELPEDVPAIDSGGKA